MRLRECPKSIMVIAGRGLGGYAPRPGSLGPWKARDPKIKLFGMGGPLMAKAGMEVREDLTRHAIMGFAEVVKHLPLSLRRMRDCERWLRKEKPDLLFLVDYPGFNLRLAERAHRLGIPVCYYVAPQVWAWHESRIPTMKKVIRKLLVILPFEKEFFHRKGMGVVYVGHPLMEEMDLGPVNRDAVLRKNGIKVSHLPLVCVMPGKPQGRD